MGEWLASQGVAFRCIQYVPLQIDDHRPLSFSVRFDRSKEPQYQLSWETRALQFYWHNIAHTPIGSSSHDIEAENQWWRHHWKEGMVLASFNNEPGDAGDSTLNSYVAQDTVIAYASGYGAIGWGVLQAPNYDLVKPEYDRFFASRLLRHCLKGIQWKQVATSVTDAIPAKELKEKFGLAHPIQTKSTIRRDHAESLIREMKARFHPPRIESSKLPQIENSIFMLTGSRNHLHSQNLGRFHTTVAGNDSIVHINQYWVGEAKPADAFGYLSDLAL